MKRIVLFADGTGNSSASPHKTNVWRAYQALDRRRGSGQIAFYDNGVGTSPFRPLAVLGLAFGLGLARNVKQIYGFLCRVYEPGDEIYAFGFSRGAFTIRVVVAFIAQQGIIDRTRAVDERDLARLVSAAYHRFRQETRTPSFLSCVLRPVRDWILRGYHRIQGFRPYDATRNSPSSETLVKFVGMWDTVDAYGLPIDELTRAWDMVVWPLTAKDRNLSPQVARVRHALSLDEQRESFEPMLWNEGGASKRAHIDCERLLQVWFPGVHANVGGGYPDDALALAPLEWILDEGAKSGLTYLSNERDRLREQIAEHGPAHDSRKGYAAFYRYAPRNLERLNKDRRPGLANWLKREFNTLLGRLNVEWLEKRLSFAHVHDNAVDIEKAVLHYTVFERIRDGADGYAPINIPAGYAVLTERGDIVDVSQGSYETTRRAAVRRKGQSRVWNRVLVRRLMYYITVIAVGMFVAYPLIFESIDGDGMAGVLEPWVGPFSDAIRTMLELVGRIPGLGLVGDLARQYSDHPLAFAVFLVVMGVLLFCGRRVSEGIRIEMLKNWTHVTNPAAAMKAAGGGLGQVLTKCRERYGRGVGRFFRNCVEAVAVLFLLFLVVSACSGLYFAVASAVGVCKPDAESRSFGETFDFAPTDICFDSGLKLTRNEEYEIDFRISGDWADETIKADVAGWIEPPLRMYGFTPLRRHLLVGWYEPVARIGGGALDVYPLAAHSIGGGPRSERPRERLVARVSARRSGRLYLYMNDAVLFTWRRFYENNKGTAKVTVSRVGE